MWDLTAEYATGSRRHLSFPTRDRARAVRRSMRRVAQVSGVPVTFDLERH